MIDCNVQEPFWSQLRDGRKVVEGRLNHGKFGKVEPGDVLRAHCDSEYILLQVICTRLYDSFEEMLQAEGIDRVLPGVSGIDKGVETYRQFYTAESEELHGVIAMTLEIVCV